MSELFSGKKIQTGKGNLIRMYQNKHGIHMHFKKKCATQVTHACHEIKKRISKMFIILSEC